MARARREVHTRYAAASDAYHDSMELTLDVPTDSPAIEWTRAVIERSPLPLRVSLPPGWWLLGMRLAPVRSPGHVHGWPIAIEEPGRVTLAGSSKLGFAAELTVEIDGRKVLFHSHMRHRTRSSYWLWNAIGLAHRTLIAQMLRHAAAELQA